MEKSPKLTATPPDLIPEKLSEANQAWLTEQLNAEYRNDRLLAARTAINLSQNPRNKRAS